MKTLSHQLQKIPGLAVAMGVLFCLLCQAQATLWTQTVAGVQYWTNNANWNGSYPNGATAEAVFTNAIAGDQTIMMDTASTITVLTQRMGSATGNFVLSNGTLRVQGNGYLIQTAGSNTIAANVAQLGQVFFSGTAVPLTISGNISGGQTIQCANGGRLVLSGSNSMGQINSVDSVNPTVDFVGRNAIGTGTLKANQWSNPTFRFFDDGDGDNGIISHVNALNMGAGQGSGSSITMYVGPQTTASGNTLVFSNGLSMGGDGGFTFSVTGANGYSLELTGLVNQSGSDKTLTLNPTTASLILNRIVNNATWQGNANIALGGSALDNVVRSWISNAVQSSAILNLSKSGSSIWDLRGPSTFGGSMSVNGGALRLSHATAVPGGVDVAGGSQCLTMNGGNVELTSATISFRRGPGTGAAQVNFSGHGGFSAYGTDCTVNLGGSGATMTWASTAGFLANGKNAIFGSVRSDAVLDFQNPINLNGAVRTIQVIDNPNSSADWTLLSGGLSGAGSGVTKTGAGTLVLGGTNTCSGTTTISDGAIWVTGVASAGGFVIGSSVSNKLLVVTNGAALNAVSVTVGSGTATGNTFTISADSFVTNLATLIVSTNNVLDWQSPALGASNANVTVNDVFTLGDGVQSRRWELLGGTHTFSNGLLVASNAVLRGAGVIDGMAAAITLTNGATFAPGQGTGNGTLTVSNTTWWGGAVYRCSLTDLAGPAGTGWDLVNAPSQLTLGDNGQNYIIDLTSEGTTVANFVSTGEYQIKIASYGTLNGTFDANRFTVLTNGLITPQPMATNWVVKNLAGNLYLVYKVVPAVVANYTWAAPSNGNWSTVANWASAASAPTNNNPDMKLEFGGSGGTAYSSTNDLGSFQINQLSLVSDATATNLLAGQTLAFANGGAGVVQSGLGVFAISNAISLTTDTVFRGAGGAGAVILGGTITGNGALTKRDSWRLVVKGSNSFNGAVLADNAGGVLQFDTQYAAGVNPVTVSNGTVFANVAAGYVVGNALANRSVLATGASSMWTNSAGFVVGLGSGATNNTVTVADGALLTANAVVVGTNSGPFNSLVLTNNARLNTTLPVTIGSKASSNTLAVATGAIWNTGGTNLVVGFNNATGNLLQVNGGMVTNIGGYPYGSLVVGDSTGSNDFNTLSIGAGGRVYVKAGETRIGNVGRYGNVMTVDNGLFLSASMLSVGLGSSAGGGTGGFSRVTITNGGTVGVASNLWLGCYPSGAGYGAQSNTVAIGGTNGAGAVALLDLGGSMVQVADAGNANWNTLTVGANGMVTNGGLVLGITNTAVQCASNTVTVEDGGLWDFAGRTLIFGWGTDNNLTAAPGGVITNLGGITMAGVGRTYVLTNDAPARNIFLGTGGGLNIGATVGRGGNALTIANQTYTSTGSSIVGNTSSNNTLTIGTNVLWNSGGQLLYIGNAGATGNVLTVTGGVITNLGPIFMVGAVADGNRAILNGGAAVYVVNAQARVGSLGGARNQMTIDDAALVSSGPVEVGLATQPVGGSGGTNTLSVINGGLLVASNLWVGTFTNQAYGTGGNTMTVGGVDDAGTPATLRLFNNTSVQVGNGTGSFANAFTVNAGGVVTNGGLVLGGVGAWSNTVTVGPGAVWYFGGQPLVFGIGTGNVLNIDATAVMTNLGGITMADAGRSFAMTDPDPARHIFLGTGGGLNVGTTAGWGGDTLTIAHQVYASGAASTIGGGSSNNTLSLVDDVQWNGGGKALTVGSGAATGNVMTAGGSVITNLSTVAVGTGGSAGNRLVLTNTAVVSSSAVTVGNAGGSNAITLLGHSSWDLQGTNLSVGVGAAGAANRLTIDGGGVTAGTVVSNVLQFTLGDNGDGNALVITNGGKLVTLTRCSLGGNWTMLSNTAGNANSVWISGGPAVSTWDLGGNALDIGFGYVAGGSVGNAVTVDGGGTAGGAVLLAGTIYVGDSRVTNGAFNCSLTVTNGGSLFSGQITVAGGLNPGSGNVYRVDGGNVGCAVTNAAIVIGQTGSASGFNSMVVTNAAVQSGMVVNGAGSSNNTVTLLADAALDLRAGLLTNGVSGTTGNVFRIDGGSVTNVGTLNVATNNPFQLLAGRFSGATAAVGLETFTVGDGVRTAVWETTGGTHTFSNGLVVASNSTLTGSGTVNGQAGGVTLNNGATIAPGSGVGTLTVNALTWNSGAVYECQIADMGQASGVGYDGLTIQGLLTFNAATTNVIRLTTMGAAAGSFSTDGDYTIKIASFGSQSGLDLSRIRLDVSNFLPATAPANWHPVLIGTNLYAQYTLSASPDGVYVWTNQASGAWADAANWTNALAPTPADTNALKFTGSGSAAYTATDNLTNAAPHVFNRVEFDSSSTATNILTGSNLQFAGTAPALLQYGAGPFIVSNGINLAGGAGLTAQGPGFGTVTLASNITGTGGLTKVGPAALVLQGSNSFSGAVLVNGAGGSLRLDNQNAVGTSPVTVSNGTVFANVSAGYVVGNGGANRSISISGTNSLWTNSANFTVGVGGAATGNVVTLNNGARLAAAAVVVGTNGAARNALTIDGGARIQSAGQVAIGFSANSNSVSVLNGGFWDVGSNSVYLGYYGSTGNTLTVTGGTLTNVNGGTVALFVGVSGVTNVGNRATISGGGKVYSRVGQVRVGSSGSGGNTLTIDNGLLQVGDAFAVGLANTSTGGAGGRNSVLVTNGGVVKSVGLFVGQYIGQQYGSTGNVVTVTGGGSLWNLGGSTVEVANAATAYSNLFAVSDGAVVTNGGLTVGGSGSTNNMVTVGANVTWYFNGLPLTFGRGMLNTWSVDPSAVLTGIGGITLANKEQSLVLTNDAASGRNVLLGTGGGLNIGATPGYGSNTLSIANQTYTSAVASVIGLGSSNNTVTLLSNTLWNAGGQAVTIGSTTGTLNGLTVDGAVVTNVGTFYMGTGVAADGNGAVIRNGARVYVNNAQTRVGDVGRFRNQLTVDNALLSSAGMFFVGLGSNSVGGVGGSNTVAVTNGGFLSVSNLFIGGYVSTNYAASSNAVTVAGTNNLGVRATLNLNGWSIEIGTATNALANALTVGAGGTLSNVGSLTVGSGASTGNQFNINGGDSTVTVSRLTVSGVNNQVNFSAGTLNVTTSDVNNGSAFLVGDGVRSATLNLQAGSTNRFANGLVVTNGSQLTGVGRIVGNTTIYGTNNVGSPMIGALTNVGTFALGGEAVTVIDFTTNRQDYLFVDGDLTLGGRILTVLHDGLEVTNNARFVVMSNTTTAIGGTLASGSAKAYRDSLGTPLGGLFIVVRNAHDVTLRWQTSSPGTVFKLR